MSRVVGDAPKGAAKYLIGSPGCSRSGPAGALRHRVDRRRQGDPESRDVDIPLAAAHFFYYAGWADKLEYAFPGHGRRPLGVAGQVIPWNFPLLMSPGRSRAALDRQHGRPQARPRRRRSRAALRGGDAGTPISARRRQHHHGRRGNGRQSSTTRTSTRSRSPATRKWGRRSSKPLAGPATRFTLELGGKAANIVFEDAPSIRRSKGSSTASGSTRAMSAVRGRGCSCRRRLRHAGPPSSRDACRR